MFFWEGDLDFIGIFLGIFTGNSLLERGGGEEGVVLGAGRSIEDMVMSVSVLSFLVATGGIPAFARCWATRYLSFETRENISSMVPLILSICLPYLSNWEKVEEDSSLHSLRARVACFMFASLFFVSFLICELWSWVKRGETSYAWACFLWMS